MRKLWANFDSDFVDKGKEEIYGEYVDIFHMLLSLISWGPLGYNFHNCTIFLACHTYYDAGYPFIMVTSKGPMPLTPIAKRLAVKLSLPVLTT